MTPQSHTSKVRPLVDPNTPEGAAILNLMAERDHYRALVERAYPAITEALNCSAHSWHGSDEARKWLVDVDAA